MTGYRFSVVPLIDEVRRRFNGRAPARVLRIGGGEWSRLRRHGLSPFQADRLAIRIGVHPAAIWPDWYMADDLEDEEVYA